MIEYISSNIGTIVVGLVILLIVVAIVTKIFRDKKNGKCTSCSCASGSCHGSSDCNHK